MGYDIKKLVLRSFEDNKIYLIPVPTTLEQNEFECVLDKIRNFDPISLLSHSCDKCELSIYGTLGW